MDVDYDSEDMKIKIVTLARAMAKIHAPDLERFLASSPTDVDQLVNYFGTALSVVTSVRDQYPWSNLKTLSLVIDVPFSYISQPVYKIAADWIKQFEEETLCTFIMSSFDWIRKSNKSNAQLKVFVALSIILRSRPGVVNTIIGLLRPPAYQLEYIQEMIPFTVWMMAQATQVDLCMGLYAWSYNLFPLLRDKLRCKPQSLDFILELIEKILSHPDAMAIILRNSAFKHVPRLFPAASFEILLPLAFPASFDRGNYTKRFEAVYPFLKEVALVDAPEKTEMEQITQQIFAFSLKFAAEGNPVLAKEATAIAAWCVTNNVDCCNHWEAVYMDNLEASVALLKKLVDEWEHHSLKLSSSPRDTRILNLTMKSFLLKNKNRITEGGGASGYLYEEADIYSKEISRRLSFSYLRGCVSITAVILVAVGAAAPMVLPSNLLGSYFNAITTTLMN